MPFCVHLTQVVFVSGFGNGAQAAAGTEPSRSDLARLSPADNPVLLNGMVLDPTQSTAIEGSEFIYYHLDIDPGLHTVESEAPTGLLFYGYEIFSSFAVSGGYNLARE